MRAGALLLLAACGGGATRTSAAPGRDAATDAVPRVDVATACAPLHPAPSNPVLGAFPRAAAPLQGERVDDPRGAFDLVSLRGKVVLVSFASTWDSLTKTERPTFRDLRDAVGDDLAVVRVLSEGAIDTATADVQGAEGYITVYDAERGCSALGAITNAWGVQAVPESFLVDRAGNVRFYFVNKRDWSTPEAAACVRALAADTTPPIAVPPLGAHPPEECPPPPPPPSAASGRGASAGVRGTISFLPTIQAPPPGVIFVLVKKADASGQPTGMPLAVDRLQYDGKPITFVLDASKQMVAGTPIAGDVVVTARWDRDGDAMTKQVGDITGSVRVTAPATDVKLVLDMVFH
jgi:hypothetical protein